MGFIRRLCAGEIIHILYYSYSKTCHQKVYLKEFYFRRMNNDWQFCKMQMAAIESRSDRR